MAITFPMIRSSLDRLREEIDNTFDRWLSRPEETAPAEQGETGGVPTVFAAGLPNIDLEDDENEIRIMAEMPGMSRDDFKVELTGNRLVIKGEKKSTREEKERNYLFTECTYGAFSRSVPLPSEVDAARAEATYKNGVLTLRMPKTEQSKARQIQVKVE